MTDDKYYKSWRCPKCNRDMSIVIGYEDSTEESWKEHIKNHLENCDD